MPRTDETQEEESTVPQPAEAGPSVEVIFDRSHSPHEFFRQEFPPQRSFVDGK